MVEAQELLSSALRGRYTVLREIGSGAMATVYLAEDLRHDRKVAIKVLKPVLAEILGAERFLTEIRTTANLQHPHILPLFDSGDAGGFLFYVMPYVAGESLRHRLARERQLPVSDALMIASAVASALDHAHRHGVIHRDIKPGNILLHEGQPQVADFGIALAVSSAGGDRLTESRFSLGTPMYMSPEQASGERAIDGRSDLFALGSVTYEMLAGEPPFAGPTTPALIAGILSRTPEPLSQRRPTVPRNVSAAVARLLEKLPADRFESGSQFARALEDESFNWPPAASPRAELRNHALVAALALAVVMSALALWTRLREPPSPAPMPTVGLTMTLPDDQFLPVGISRSVLELSPDGRHLVYVGQRGRETQLYIRTIAGFEVRALPGTNNAREPFFSPDGEWVAFFADGGLKKTQINGGSPLEITETPGISYGGHWGEDGTILYSLSDSSLWRVAADGGTPTELPLIMTHLDRDRPAGRASRPLKWPRFLPDGKHALVTVGWVDEDGRPNQAGLVGVVDLETREFRPLLEGSRPLYVRSGHIVFDAGLQRIHAVPFDLDRLQVTGPVQSLADNALRSGGSGANFTASLSGALAYPTGGFDRTLVIVDRNGRETPVNVPRRGYRLVHASPGGRYVAVTVDPQPPHIWVVDLERERASPLTTDGYNLNARWSPDGSRLAFVRLAVDTPGVYTMRWPDGGAPVLIYPTEEVGNPEWASETQLILQLRGVDIALLDTRTRTTTMFLDTRADERFPALSPDGKWLAYTSNVTGVDEVYVASFPETRARVSVSSGGGAEPRWSADGSELFFRNGNTILSVKTRTTPTFEFASAVDLFTAPYDFSSVFNWDVLPDGRFVMVKSNPRIGREIRLVFNGIEPPGS
jgi:serine/threonine-protein kinase